LQKYFASHRPSIGGYFRRPASIRGAYRDRHGRWVRDAVDAMAAQDERRHSRTAKSCGPGAPTLALSWRSDPLMTVAKEPGHRGEREGNRKTIAQGMPDRSAYLW
jgi:hypothetical protein